MPVQSISGMVFIEWVSDEFMMLMVISMAIHGVSIERKRFEDEDVRLLKAPWSWLRKTWHSLGLVVFWLPNRDLCLRNHSLWIQLSWKPLLRIQAVSPFGDCSIPGTLFRTEYDAMFCCRYKNRAKPENVDPFRTQNKNHCLLWAFVILCRV